MPEVVEINRIEQLENFYLVWNSLLAETPGGSFFQSLDWLTAYWRHFGHDQKLRVLVVYSCGRPIGIVPLVIVRERTRVGRIRTLTYPLHDWASYYGPIGPNPAATLYAAMAHLQRTQRDWDMLDLRWIDRDRHDRGRTATAMQIAGLSCRESVWKETGVIDTSLSWDEYFASRTSKFRNNIRRAEKRVAQLGALRLERLRPRGAGQGDDDPRWELYDACVDLAARSWQGSSTTGTTLSHPTVSGFLREVHSLAAKHGALDLSLLWVGDRLAAFGYNYCCQANVFGLRTGTDPQYAKQGLGTVLYCHMFRDSMRRGDRQFDLGPGSIQSKYRWLTQVAKSYRCTHYPRYVPRAQLLRLRHWTREWLDVADGVRQPAL